MRSVPSKYKGPLKGVSINILIFCSKSFRCRHDILDFCDSICGDLPLILIFLVDISLHRAFAARRERTHFENVRTKLLITGASTMGALNKKLQARLPKMVVTSTYDSESSSEKVPIN